MRLTKKLPLGHIGYWAAAIVIALMGSTLYETSFKARDASHRLNHSFQVLQAISDLDASLSAAEAGQSW